MTIKSFPSPPAKGEEKEVIVLLSDMVNYSRNVGSMPLAEIRNYMYNYHLRIREIIEVEGKKRHTFEPSDGDGTVAIYDCNSVEDKKELAELAVDTAIKISRAIALGELPATRLGLFSGTMVQAVLDSHILRFTLAFAAARRLEKLCDYFQTSFLMGKEIAQLQTRYCNNVVCIGKITPRHFNHPIHIFTVYAPGIHNCPQRVDPKILQRFIRIKNEAVIHFCGNEQKNAKPDFHLAKEKLTEASELFQRFSGTVDIATERLLEYIEENPLPSPTFIANGMRITEERHISADVSIPSMAESLLKSLDRKLHDSLLTIKNREENFDVIWRKEGEQIFAKGEKPNGIYFIAAGTIRVEDNGKLLATLEPGDIFGEMAYFSRAGRRTATIIAGSDIVLRRMKGQEMEDFAEIKKIFQTIANRREITNS